jgi:flagellar hook assembly protein FlgD
VLAISGLWAHDASAGDIIITGHDAPATTHGDILFAYYTKSDDHVTFEIFNVEGRIIVTLVNEHKTPGLHEVSWDGKTASGKPVPAGVYFARVRNSRGSDTEKVMIVK